MIDDANSSAKPPPALASEQVLHYALLDDSVGFNAGHKLNFYRWQAAREGPAPCDLPSKEKLRGITVLLR